MRTPRHACLPSSPGNAFSFEIDGSVTRALLRLGLLTLPLLAVLACHPKDRPKEDVRDSDEDSLGVDTSVHSGETGDSKDSKDSKETADTDDSKETGETGDTTETADTCDTDTGPDDTEDTSDTSDTDSRYVDIDEAAVLMVYSELSSHNLGRPFVLGDVTGDGADDLCFMNMGLGDYTCWGFRSPPPEGLFEAEEVDFIVQVRDQTYFGTPGDVNGDGIADLDIENFVLLGPLADDESEKTVDITISYDDSWLDPGAMQTNPGDSDGDGINDLLLNFHRGEFPSAWYWLMVFSGIDAPSASTDDAAASLLYAGSSGPYGFLGDINGDGFDDLYYNLQYALLGPISGDLYDVEDVYFYNSAGIRPVGDINGDGYDDAIGPATDTVTYTEQVRVYLAPFLSTMEMDDATASIRVEGADSRDDLEPVTGIGDQNGDSCSDIAFVYSDRASGYYDVVYIFETPIEGALSETDAARELQSSGSRLRITELDGPADFQGDGSDDDFLIGDQFNDAFAPHGGVGWVLLGGTFP